MILWAILVPSFVVIWKLTLKRQVRINCWINMSSECMAIFVLSLKKYPLNFAVFSLGSFKTKIWQLMASTCYRTRKGVGKAANAYPYQAPELGMVFYLTIFKLKINSRIWNITRISRKHMLLKRKIGQMPMLAVYRTWCTYFLSLIPFFPISFQVPVLWWTKKFTVY